MVDPRVLEMAGVDPEEYTGFAAGFGVERFAMVLFEVQDLRNFWNSDMRFLKQFPADIQASYRRRATAAAAAAPAADIDVDGNVSSGCGGERDAPPQQMITVGAIKHALSRAAMRDPFISNFGRLSFFRRISTHISKRTNLMPTKCPRLTRGLYPCQFMPGR